jgi:MacB-like periplasmic core domain
LHATLRLAAHGLRSRWQGWLALVILLAIAGGVVLAAIAGARRTESAYPRFLAWSGSSDMTVSAGGLGVSGYYAAVAHLPQVAEVAPVVGLNLAPAGPDGHVDPSAVVVAPLDRRYGTVVDRPRLLAGRMPRAARANEIVIDQQAAAMLGVHVGSTVRAQALPNSGAHVRVLRVRVVGVIVTRTSIAPVTDSEQAPFILASTATWRELGRRYEGLRRG